ncbi:MAG TPA: EpsI family protein, partial [Planctomycetaceae bacterium]|nr:EpsI family protein [Planctomycetaceae bacterium]
EQRETDERLFRAIGAEKVLSRRYVNPGGRELSLHMAVFNSRDDRMPHSPMVCYPSAGWTLIEQTTETLKVAGAPPLTIRLVTFEKEGRRSLVAFWYQFAEHSVFDEIGMREAKLDLRGNKNWPSLIKVLIDIDASNREQAKKHVVEFASLVYANSSRMQTGETSVRPGGESAKPPTADATKDIAAEAVKQ